MAVGHNGHSPWAAGERRRAGARQAPGRPAVETGAAPRRSSIADTFSSPVQTTGNRRAPRVCERLNRRNRRPSSLGPTIDRFLLREREPSPKASLKSAARALMNLNEASIARGRRAGSAAENKSLAWQQSTASYTGGRRKSDLQRHCAHYARCKRQSEDYLPPVCIHRRAMGRRWLRALIRITLLPNCGQHRPPAIARDRRIFATLPCPYV